MSDSRAKDGGPAFPFEYHNQTSRPQESFLPDRPPVIPGASEQYGGMSLRDWFAGQALIGIVTAAAGSTTHDDTVANAVYQIADAMLKARSNV